LGSASRSCGGQSDWRLPNAKELLSALADARANPAIDPAYFRWAAVTVWTSTALHATGSEFGFVVELSTGFGTGAANRGALLPHACARGG